MVVCAVPNKNLCSVFMEQHRKHQAAGSRGTGYFTEIFLTVSLESKSLAPTDPDNKHDCLSTNYHKWLLLISMVHFRKLLSAFVFALLSANDTHVFSGSEAGQGGGCSLRL